MQVDEAKALVTIPTCAPGREPEERAREDDGAGGQGEGDGQGEGLPQQTTQPEPAAGQ